MAFRLYATTPTDQAQLDALKDHAWRLRKDLSQALREAINLLLTAEPTASVPICRSCGMALSVGIHANCKESFPR